MRSIILLPGSTMMLPVMQGLVMQGAQFAFQDQLTLLGPRFGSTRLCWTGARNFCIPGTPFQEANTTGQCDQSRRWNWWCIQRSHKCSMKSMVVNAIGAPRIAGLLHPPHCKVSKNAPRMHSESGKDDNVIHLSLRWWVVPKLFLWIIDCQELPMMTVCTSTVMHRRS